jgi:phosphatidylserine/phosphatidylglycerophosphate/cardiolipin synthase-like enzyme
MGSNQHRTERDGAGGDTLDVRFLEEGSQRATEVAEWIASFIGEARETLDIAIYDCHLSREPAAILREALAERRDHGVRIRVVYDDGAKPETEAGVEDKGVEPAPRDTNERVKELDLPDEYLRAVRGERALMHQKYLVRDGKHVWTGSLNLTDDSMSRMENIIVTLTSGALANFFARDFAQLWRTQEIAESGAFPTSPDILRYEAQPAETDVDFSPGQGEEINERIANRVMNAQQRIIICSMLINSSELLRALVSQLDRGKVEMSGVYDHTQMMGVLDQWREVPELAWKIEAVERVIREAGLVGKQSEPYRAGESNNFMHNKSLVVDGTVMTGSYNLSHNAQANAENMLAIKSPPLAGDVIGYTRALAERFRNGKGHFDRDDTGHSERHE